MISRIVIRNAVTAAPQRKSDGSFNYSPDIYCDKYDENTGICPDGDECVYLHRVSGDVERKYHLRYYKTAQCVHPTDSRGQCAKNGAHCAFAHSSADLRQPQFDQHEAGFSTTMDGDGRDRTSFVIEDPLWHSSAGTPSQAIVLGKEDVCEARRPY
nr:Zinc finger domain containing protein [Haemonchus contortus]